jgi:hypothetical protein
MMLQCSANKIINESTIVFSMVDVLISLRCNRAGSSFCTLDEKQLQVYKSST